MFKYFVRKMTSAAFNHSLQITLDPTEQKICSLLLQFCNDSKNKSTLRITGGWVRDKLLNKTSHDLDIAIDNSTGVDFAERLNEYILANATVLNIEPRSVHKIERNPDKSKHLETATTKLYGLDVDFVNLRAEEYANKDSRIPSTVRFGTPEEDAKRRDATLNALFYNIQQAKVEDYTGTGVQDLQAGLLRTPLDPLETFTEDPLRVLRLIRFRSVFGFTIEENTLRAMANESIRNAMLQKVSRERIGIEVAKMLASPAPALALSTINLLGLEDAVFWLPDVYNMTHKPKSTAEVALACIIDFYNDTAQLHPDLAQVLKDRQSTIYLTAILSKWGQIEVLNEKKRPAPAVAFIVKEGLRLSSSEGALVAKLLASDVVQLANDPNPSRLDLGQFVRASGPEWRLYVLIGIFRDLLNTTATKESLYAKYSALMDKIYSHRVEDAYKLQPILNGKEVLAVFNEGKAGPWLGDTLQKLINLQLEQPSLTKDQAKEFLLQNKPNLLKKCIS